MYNLQEIKEKAAARRAVEQAAAAAKQVPAAGGQMAAAVAKGGAAGKKQTKGHTSNARGRRQPVQRCYEPAHAQGPGAAAAEQRHSMNS